MSGITSALLRVSTGTVTSENSPYQTSQARTNSATELSPDSRIGTNATSNNVSDTQQATAESPSKHNIKTDDSFTFESYRLVSAHSDYGAGKIDNFGAADVVYGKPFEMNYSDTVHKPVGNLTANLYEAFSDFQNKLSKDHPDLPQSGWGFSINADNELIIKSNSLDEKTINQLQTLLNRDDKIKSISSAIADTLVLGLDAIRGKDQWSMKIGRYDLTRENFADIIDFRKVVESPIKEAENFLQNGPTLNKEYSSDWFGTKSKDLLIKSALEDYAFNLFSEQIEGKADDKYSDYRIEYYDKETKEHYLTEPIKFTNYKCPLPLN